MPLIVKRPWTSQPQVAARVDWGNPITRGLLSAQVNRVETVSGAMSGHVQVGVTLAGLTERGSDAVYYPRLDVADVTIIGHMHITSDNGDYAGLIYGFYTSGTVNQQIGVGIGPITAGAPDVFGVHRSDGPANTVLEADVTLPYSAVWGISGTVGSSVAAATYKNGVAAATVAKSGAGVFALNSAKRTEKFVAGSVGKGSAWMFRWGRILTAREHAEIARNPWQLFAPLPRRIWAPGAAAGGGITGTLAATEAGSDTAALSGQVVVSGALSAVESGADSLAAAGAVLVQGSLAATEAGEDTAAISGGAVAIGTLAATETGNDTAAAAGVVLVQGAIAGVEAGDDTATISGGVAVAGALSAAESGADTAAISGSNSAAGTLSANEIGDDTAAIAGIVQIVGAASASEAGADILAATGAVLVAGLLSAVEGGLDTSAAAGQIIVAGLLAAAETGGDSAQVIQAAPAVGSAAAVWDYILPNGLTAGQTVADIHAMLLAGTGRVDVRYVNGVQIKGAGVAGNTWGPA